MPTRKVVLIEQREAEEAAKLEALREAARVGFEAIERGKYQEFDSGEDLTGYLHELSERAMTKAAK